MALNKFAIECPQCGRLAIEEEYYKAGEKTIICHHCGYYYSKKIEKWIESSIKYKVEKCEGHGVMSLVQNDGKERFYILNAALSHSEIDKHHNDYLKGDLNQEKSFLVTTKNDVFTIQFGAPPENFHLSFEENIEKMLEKYREDKSNKIFATIEE